MNKKKFVAQTPNLLVPGTRASELSTAEYKYKTGVPNKLASLCIYVMQS